MTFKWVGTVLAGGLAAILIAATAVAQAAPEVRAVRFGQDGAQTRIVVETGSAAEFRAFTLSEPTARLVFELPRSAWAVPGLETGEGRGHGLVETFRFFDAAADTSRIVFELSDMAVVERAFSIPPGDGVANHRLVIDITQAAPEAFEAASGFPAPQELSTLISERAEATYPEPPRVRQVIVIDPGHGGRDPGAVSANGTRESDVVLAAGLELRRQLEATGRYEVHMTRSDDRYPEWEERARIASVARANLFISLHADSGGPNTTVRGASVYTLNATGEGRAQTRALQAISADGGVPRRYEVNSILASLQVREKQNQSSVFAQILVPHLQTIGPVVANPLRQSNLFVLLDSEVPAVLLEMGFLTNPVDEANLLTPSYRQQLMTAIVSAIDQYFERGRQLQTGPERFVTLQPAP